jgi:SAM-dependent methyltransferase
MDNTERFTGRTTDYIRFREPYNASVVLPRLREWCGLQSSWLVADIAAGTGMLTELFLANGNPTIAIEPNAEMRTACSMLLPKSDVRNGTAEVTALEAHSIDLVSVGRALHWFDFDKAIAEFRRILKPAGWLAVIASGRDETGSAANDAFDQVLRQFGSTSATTRAGYANYFRLPAAFEGGISHHEETTGELVLTWEQLRGYASSVSYAPLPTAPNFQDFQDALRKFFDDYQSDSVVRLVSRHWINVGQFAKHAKQ